MYDPGQTIRLRASARTNTGRVRDNNEDTVHLWTYNDYIVLAIVADGMGGAVAGEEASKIAVKTIQEGLSEDSLQQTEEQVPEQDDLTGRLKEVINAANANIVDQAHAQPQYKGMGTTVTLALVRDSHVVIGHVGDSRAYQIDGKDGHIHQITSDHSFVQALIAAGHISEEEAEDHPMKNVLYRALGQGHEVEIDIYYEKLHTGDRLVLCSDGLTLHVKPDEIAQVTLAEDDPARASQKLIDLANQRGGRDNVSVIVIKAESGLDDNTITAEVNQVEQPDSEADYDDEDTLLIPGARSLQALEPDIQPQESATPSPDQEQATDDLLADTVVPIRQEAETDKGESLGEGRDTSTPDQ
jgi:PPM family protein phosphatase